MYTHLIEGSAPVSGNGSCFFLPCFVLFLFPRFDPLKYFITHISSCIQMCVTEDDRDPTGFIKLLTVFFAFYQRPCASQGQPLEHYDSKVVKSQQMRSPVMSSIGLAVEKLTAGSLEWLIRPND